MKKTGKILSILVIAVLLIVIIVSNNTNAAGPVNFVSSVSENQSINIGDTFNITFKPTPVANGDGSTEPVKFNMMNFSIDYDPSVFEYKSSTSNPELTVNAYENKISVVYNIQNKSDVSMDSLTITFKAIKETESDGSTIAIVEDNFSIGLSNRTEPVAYSNLISEGAILSAKIKVNPNQPTPTFEDPILDKNAVTVEIGKSVNVNIENKDKIGKYEWKSENDNIAVVDSEGKITGVSENETNVILTSEGGSKTVKVTVTGGEQPDEDTPKLSETLVELRKGESKEITSDRDVTWSSGNETIATVEGVNSTTGKITAISKGTAIITATASNGKQFLVIVNVADIADGNQDDNNSDNNDGQNSDNQNQGNNNQEQPNNNQNENQTDNNNGKANSNNRSTTKSTTQTTSTTTNGTETHNSSSSANEVVPATGESSVGTVALLIITTLIVASIIFKKKSKIK